MKKSGKPVGKVYERPVILDRGNLPKKHLSRFNALYLFCLFGSGFFLQHIPCGKHQFVESLVRGNDADCERSPDIVLQVVFLNIG